MHRHGVRIAGFVRDGDGENYAGAFVVSCVLAFVASVAAVAFHDRMPDEAPVPSFRRRAAGRLRELPVHALALLAGLEVGRELWMLLDVWY